MASGPDFPRDYKHLPGARRRRGGAAQRPAGAVFRATRAAAGRPRPTPRDGADSLTTRVRGLAGQARRLVSRFGQKAVSRFRLRPPRDLSGPQKAWLGVGLALVLFPLLSLTVEAIGSLSPAWRSAEAPMRQHLALPAPALPDTETAGQPNTPPWRIEKVGKGDTLAAVFQRLGLSPRDVHDVVNLDDNSARLARIYPGDALRVRLDHDGELDALEYQLNETSRLLITRAEEGLRSELVDDNMLSQLRHASGVISDSLFLAGRESGLSDALIMEMAGLFGWDIDFVLDIRRGDSFHLIYEELYRNGEFLRAGDIVAATFVNQGEKFQAVRFETENGAEYFSPDGRNMRKAFLRAPLNFSYISSNFNPRRFHPILQRVKAHNGTDYRAPTGTPVYAAGHGKVVASARNQYNGHYVFIEHGNNIVTKYLHFTRRTVKRGQRVKQGQVIGYVGATGLAQAPHLHYEFLVNGVHRNPRTVDLPKADPLPSTQLAAFQQVAAPLLNQLDLMADQTLLAQQQ